MEATKKESAFSAVQLEKLADSFLILYIVLFHAGIHIFLLGGGVNIGWRFLR